MTAATKEHAAATRHGTEPASLWVQRWSYLVKPQGTVLDVASGRGRHSIWFYQRNHPVVTVDIDDVAIKIVANTIPADRCECIVADLENGPWPLTGRTFDAVVVTHYLWRPLLPTLLASLNPGGVLIYETFTQGNETVGKPSRPDFLLRTAELLAVCSGLRVVAFEDGFEGESATGPVGQPGGARQAGRFIQRIAAVREPLASSPAAATPLRYPINPLMG